MNKKMTSTLLSQGLMLALAAGYAANLRADTPPRPDAGQILQQVPDVPLSMPATEPVKPVDVEEKATDQTAANTQARFTVRHIRVTGGTVFTAAQLESLVVALAGSEQSLASLQDAAKRITRFYRDHGYLVARAYLPAQTITDGEVTINVLEGHLGAVTLNNRSLVNDSTVNAYAQAQLTPGEALTVRRLNRTLVLLSDVPGIAQAQGALKAGQSIGLSDLTLYLPPDKCWQGVVSVDNFGTIYTGKNRVFGHLIVNSPLHIGDRLDLQAGLSDGAQTYANASWDAPIGYQGLRAGLDLTYNRYELGDIFAPLEVHGTTQMVGAHARYPLVMDLKSRVYANASLAHSAIEDDADSVNVTIEKTLQTLVLGLNGTQTGSRQTFNWRIDGSAGKLATKDPDAFSAKIDGNYAKLLIDANWLASVSETVSVYLRIKSQLANHNLDSSERFSLAGSEGVRAYPVGDGQGDEGWLGTFELRARVLPLVEVFALYDTGSAKFNHDPFIKGDNTRQLSGSGLGLKATLADSFDLVMTAAWRGNQASFSEKDEKPRMWLLGRYRF